MSNFVTPDKTASRRFEPGGVYFGTTVRVDESINRVWVKIPRFINNFEFGPLAVVGPDFPKVDDRVACLFVENRTDNILVIGVIKNQSTLLNSFIQVATSATRPNSPTTGTIIFETDTENSYIWSGTAWVSISDPNIGTGPQGPQGPQGDKSRLTPSDTPPLSPITGDLWLDSTSGITYVWYDSYWVELGSGAQGFQGPTGAQGATGSIGLTGAQGSQGVQGATGAQGPQGFQGAVGPQGNQGVQGAVGAQGPQGFQGAVGPQGSQGTQGTQGVQGAVGAQGPQGFQGSVGAQGPQGVQGAVGLQGPQGVQGSTGPQGAQGVQGAVGAQGSQGAVGSQGAAGAQGAVGPQGTQGFQGDVGAQGAVGSQGAAGAQGVAGAQGSAGPQGAAGSQGAAGAQGPQGFQGVGVATGGTTNQFLVKNSGTNFDTAWSSALTADSVTMTSGGSKKITTAGTELVLEQTGDAYGAATFKLRNRYGSGGGLFAVPAGFGVVDLGFDPGLIAQSNIRFEARGPYYGTIKVGPTPDSIVEFQLVDNSTNVGGTGVTFYFCSNKTATVVRAGVFGVGVDNPSAQVHFVAASASTVGEIVQGAASQTADLSQWRNSSGTVLARVTSSGGARFVPRVTTITSSATPTINTDNCDAVTITAQAAAITSMTTNLSGTPNNFDRITFRIKDDGTARAITWGASFAAMGVPLPTTTVANKVTTVSFIYDSVVAKWGCVASVVEA